MEGETGEGDVDGVAAVARGGGGEGAAQGLEDEGDDVAGDEDPIVELGGEAGVLRTEVVDAVFGKGQRTVFFKFVKGGNPHLRERDIDGCRVEDWGDCDTDCSSGSANIPQDLRQTPGLRRTRRHSSPNPDGERTDLEQKPAEAERVVV